MLARGFRALHILLVSHPPSGIHLLVTREAVVVRGLSVLPASSDLDGSHLASLGKDVMPDCVGTESRVLSNCRSSHLATPHSLGVG